MKKWSLDSVPRDQKGAKINDKNTFVDDEYNEYYYLNASLYPLMSKLMYK
jgi:hypothetical protein